MKRPTYKIQIDGREISIRHSWNSALNEARNLVCAIAKEREQDYSLVDKNYTKIGFTFISGLQAWRGSDGHKIIVTICKF